MKLVLKIFNIYLFIRKREPVGEVERERETHNLKEAPGSELSAQSLTQGLNPRTMRL